MTLPVVSPNSAFWLRLQQDGVDLTEIVDVELPNGLAYHWTTCNQPITYTLSGALTTYTPFPGTLPGGMEETNNLQVTAANFVIQNSGSDLHSLVGNDFQLAAVKAGRVFASTPDLGRMEIYNGQVGDFQYNREQIKGQSRNIWKSLGIKWPYFLYQDTCGWRFGSAGCGIATSSITVAIGSVQVGSSTTLDILCAATFLTRSYNAGDLDFGRLTVTAGVNSGVIRTIRTQTGDLISLASELPYSDFTGIQFNVYPGCRKRLIADCKSKFNNDKNYHGWPWILVQEQAF